MTMMTPEQIEEAVARLNREGQLLLGLIAVHGNFSTQQAIFDAASVCPPLANSEGRRLEIKHVRRHLARMRELGLIGGKGYDVSDALAHRLCAWLASNGVMEDIGNAASWSFDRDTNARYYYYDRGPRTAARVRVAFYTANSSALNDLLAKEQYAAPHAYERILQALPPSVGQRAWFCRFDAQQRMAIVERATSLALARLDDVDPWLDTLKEAMESVGSDHSSLMAIARCLQGRPKDARVWLTDATDPQCVATQALISMIEGDLETAKRLHMEAFELLRKGTRKRNIYLQGWAGILSTLAFFGAPQGVEISALRDRLERGAKGSEVSGHQWLLGRISHVCEVLLGRRSSARHSFFGLSQSRPSVEAMVALFCEYWLGSRPPRKDERKALIEAASWLTSMFQNKGYAWLADECEALESRLKGNDQSSEVCRLVDFAPAPENWEAALNALESMAISAQSAATESKERLIWRVTVEQVGNSGRGRRGRRDEDIDAIDITPIVQKRGKRGWTKGREVSVTTLGRKGLELAYLTAHDRRVCATLEDKWGYYLEPEKVLPLLAGHPLVFLGRTGQTPLEITSRNVSLQITRKGQSLHLKLDPPVVRGRSVEIVKHAPTRWDVVVFDESLEDVATLIGRSGVTIPASAEGRLRKAVGALTSKVDIQGDVADIGAAIEAVEPCKHLFMQVLPEGDGLSYQLLAMPLGLHGPSARPGEGSAAMIAESMDGKPQKTTRDLVAERSKLARIEALPELAAIKVGSGRWYCEDPLGNLEALSALKSLADDELEMVWPRGEAISVTRSIPTESLSVQIARENDWFEANGSLAIDEGKMLQLHSLLLLLSRSEGRFLKLDDGQYLALSRRLHTQLQSLNAHAQIRGQRARIHPLSASELGSLGDDFVVDADKAWQEQVARIAQADDRVAELPSTLTAELRDYQIAGFQWLDRLSQWGAGACLADDMGLGKTLQTLAILLTRAPNGPALVVAPTSVCANWELECRRFAPTLNPVRYGGSAREEAIDQCGPLDVLVVSYGLLQQDVERFQSRTWNSLVLDEAQAVKNARTKRARAAARINASFKVALTGTPIENHLGDLWSIFHIINPGLLDSWDRFRQRFVHPIEQGEPEPRDALKQLISPFVLRRLKSDVLTELPPRTEIVRSVTLSDAETALYESIRQQALERVADGENDDGHFRVLAELTRLRQACCHPDLIDPRLKIPSSKLKATLEIVEEMRQGRHKALLFSQFTSHLALVREALDEHGVSYQYLDGATPPARRQEAIERFQRGEGDLFLISLKAGGTGLNLTAADYVIHLDPWWNPAVEDQASDRAHRMGQERPVTIYRLVAEGTIEDKIVALHGRKRELAESLLSGADGGARLSAKDVLELLKS